MRQSRVRQEDIAKLVGVSVSTVSRVLSGAPGISRATTEKVLKAAADLGTPLTLPAGRGAPMANPRIKRALLLQSQADLNSGSASIYHFIMTGLKNAAAEVGLRVELALFGDDGAIPSQILGGTETGVLFAGVDPEPALMKSLLDQGHPTVMVNGIDLTMTHDHVAPNNYFGGWLAAQHLLEMGHRRILHLGTRRRETLAARNLGFRAAIEQLGGAEVACDHIEMESVTEQSAHRFLLPMLAEGRFPYTAVFCAADTVALGVMQDLRMHGLNVPGDVSILGFNGLPLAEFSSPLLSTLHVDWEHLGTEAIRLLAARSAQPGSPTHQILTQVKLKPGDSVLDLRK